MYCPKCKQPTEVTDSREMTNGNGIRRRRRCKNNKCKHRFTTFEEYENSENITELRELRDKLRRGSAVMKMAQDILWSSE